MTEKQYTCELFNLYKDRQFVIETIVEYGPDHDWFLAGAVPTAGEDLKEIDMKIFDLVKRIYNDENDIFSEWQYNLSILMDNIQVKLAEEAKQA